MPAGPWPAAVAPMAPTGDVQTGLDRQTVNLFCKRPLRTMNRPSEPLPSPTEPPPMLGYVVVTFLAGLSACLLASAPMVLS